MNEYKVVFEPEYFDANRNQKSKIRQKNTDFYHNIGDKILEEMPYLKPQQVKILATEKFLRQAGLNVRCVETTRGMQIVHSETQQELVTIPHITPLIYALYDLYFRGAFDSANSECESAT